VKRRLRFSRRGWREIERASTWWRRHRDKAPDAFDTDVDQAIDRIRSNPHAGIPVRAKRIGIRALWLDRIGYFIYYVEAPDDVIEILALWHASRGTRPRF
jgi:plasmid stabilization system protein ParE